ncbi:MAG: hypothetical protein GEU86_07055 [Actinophytocola sp.]|nr:hypothetical protein [Actinophytocola sp.]
MTSQSSYVLEASGWHITEGHADWLESDTPLASVDSVRAAYLEVDSLIRPFAQYRIIGLLHEDVGRTEYAPVAGGTGVRLVVSPSGMSVESFEVCVAEERNLGLVDSCDCTACADAESFSG